MSSDLRRPPPRDWLHAYFQLTDMPFPAYEAILLTQPEHVRIYAYLDARLRERGYREHRSPDGIQYTTIHGQTVLIDKTNTGEESDKLVHTKLLQLARGPSILLIFSKAVFIGSIDAKIPGGINTIQKSYTTPREAVNWFLYNL